jgi:acyl-coenzyme A thioesterase PaaI-like protein
MSFRAKVFENPRLFRLVMNVYPPYLGAGIRVVHVAADFGEIVVELRASKLTANAFGTHFGGSLYAMADPFYALMLVAKLGRDYIVWDKAAQIDFVRPGTGTVTARFVLGDAQVEEIRSATAASGKFEPVYKLEIRNAANKVVARVTKTLHIRKREPK